MKKLLFSLPYAVPLALCLAGCPSSNGLANVPSNAVSSGSSSNNVANVATSNEAVTSAPSPKTATSKVTPKATPKSVVQTATKTTAKTAPAKAPDKTYRVVDEAQPGFPPVIVKELHKLAVAPPPASMKVPEKARLLFSTSKGDITVQLNGKAAPLHVKSFVYLAQKGYFNGTTFHRFADLTGGQGDPARIIQGGDPLSKNLKFRALAGAGGPGYTIPREYNSLRHDAMVLAMARTANPDSAGSQFYFTLDATPFLDKDQAQDGFGYTVFGKVVKGQNVVLKLQQNDVLKRVSVVK